MDDSSSHPHVVLFPYMSKGHTIPLLQFARLLLRHRRISTTDRGQEPTISVTIFTTPKNQSFISNFFSSEDATSIKVISLPFPQNVAGLPPGVESTDKLPSMSFFLPFTRATKSLQPHFEEELKNLPHVSFMVSDGFIGWTLESANKFKIPRLAFNGMNSYSRSISSSVFVHKLFTKPNIVISDTESLPVPDYPWIRVKKCDVAPAFTNPDPSGPVFKLVLDQIETWNKSQGFIVNSFDELEPAFAGHQLDNDGPKSWCVGPLCLVQPPKPGNDKPAWIHWLDRKQEEGRSVLYVAFGTQADLSNEQIKEIALGLEDSKINYLWITTRDVEEVVGELEFEKKVKEHGMIVRDWVNQWEILSHGSVKGFLSHCGWNSALESICAGIPLLAWPMTADQPLNAKLVVEELKIGIRIETEDGTVEGLVTRNEISRKVEELMKGEIGKTASKNVKEYAKMAKKALVQETGSSWKNLNSMLEELCKTKEPNGVSNVFSQE